MIVKISESSASASIPLEYNRNKVCEGIAALVSVANIGEGQSPEVAFRLRENANIRTRNVSFHMFVCPSAEDAFDDGKTSRFVSDLMKGLGYGDQPYVVFRHDDHEVPHYHVVSTRLDGNGRKINDYLEGRRCQQLMKDLSREYSYSIGDGGNAPDEERVRPEAVRFDRKKGKTGEQFRAIFSECLGYRFTTYEQFKLIMKGHGVLVSERGEGDTWKMILQGLDSDGRPCTKRLDEAGTGLGMYGLYERRALECGGDTAVMKREKERVANLTRFAFGEARNERHFASILKKCSVDVEFYWDRNDRVVGFNFVDNLTMCAFKGSEIKDAIIPEMVNDATDSGRWREEDEDAAPEFSGGINMGDFLYGLDGAPSKNHEKDPRDDPKKKRKKIFHKHY